MELLIKDYNNATHIIDNNYATEWNELEQVLNTMPLHLKASDQAGRQGQPIFDPVGTNAYIKNNMIPLQWLPNVTIPSEYNFLGKDIDFVKSGILVEVQFSNYPFLLNNLLRSELFFHAGTRFSNTATNLLIVVTKANMFPCSNSTLYYEQAVNQLDALASKNVFDIPIRLVGLTSEYLDSVPCKFTTYVGGNRYSRTVENVDNSCVQISRSTGRGTKAIISR